MAADKYTFTDVCVHRRDHVYVAAIADELADEDEDHALIFRWLREEWAHRPLPFAVGSICQLQTPQPLVISMGIDGQLDLFTNPGAPGQAAEHVDESEDGPSDLLHLKCIRPIGAHVYAAGMARCVYRRDRPGAWTAIDAGVFVPRKARAIAASAFLPSTDFPRKRSMPSDTAVKSGAMTAGDGGNSRVRRMSRFRQFAASTIKSPSPRDWRRRSPRQDGHWEALDHEATDDDFWGMTVFQGRVYLAAYSGLFVIDGDDVVPLDMHLSEKPSTAYLDANDGVMWSVGEKDLAYTEDAVVWTEVESPE